MPIPAAGWATKGVDQNQDRQGCHRSGSGLGVWHGRCVAGRQDDQADPDLEHVHRSISIDRTFEAHPENIEIAEEARAGCWAGHRWHRLHCARYHPAGRRDRRRICEVNAAPGFRMHTPPTIGDPQNVARPVVDMLFPPATSSRIPIVAATGTNGKTMTSRMIAHILKGIGLHAAGLDPPVACDLQWPRHQERPKRHGGGCSCVCGRRLATRHSSSVTFARRGGSSREAP